MPAAARVGDYIKQDVPHCHTMHPNGPVPAPIPHPAMPLALVGPGVSTVMIGGKPAAVAGDQSTPCMLTGCIPAGPGVIANGSTKVMIGSIPAARVGDITQHASCAVPPPLIPAPVGKVIEPGCPTVIING
jgi:uncharacterized Zn-binding protein involved in type VI secretion